MYAKCYVICILYAKEAKSKILLKKGKIENGEIRKGEYEKANTKKPHTNRRIRFSGEVGEMVGCMGVPSYGYCMNSEECILNMGLGETSTTRFWVGLIYERKSVVLRGPLYNNNKFTHKVLASAVFVLCARFESACKLLTGIMFCARFESVSLCQL